MPGKNETMRVLLVDDEAGFRQPLAKRLNKRGLVVRQAGNGLEALSTLAREEVEVVVLDVKMPEMDGLTALARIKAEYPDVEVILLTGHVSAADGVAGMMNGAFDYLSKPVETEHLLGKIRQAFDKIKRAEEKAREAEFRAKVEQRMSEAERLASLGTMAAGVAHEINNPLAIIAEAAGWLKSRVKKEQELPDDLRDKFTLALGKIEVSVDRAKKITHQLLTFARQQDSMVKEIDLDELVAEVIELVKKTALDAQSEVKADFLTEETLIWSDPYQLRQVLINVVTNGIQAAESGGRINLTVSGDKHEVQLIIKDNGPGIPKENLERIFEPFFSTKPPGKGTGLGLSVSKGIVEKLDGKILVESELGHGATFKIILPRCPDLTRGRC